MRRVPIKFEQAARIPKYEFKIRVIKDPPRPVPPAEGEGRKAKGERRRAKDEERKAKDEGRKMKGERLRGE